VAVILGTGLGAFAQEVETIASIPYTDIPHFPLSTVETHAGRLVFGRHAGKDIVILQGRFHLYEGYSMQEITYPVRVLRELGVQHLLVSNACGTMNPYFRKGNIMIIDDHINLLGDNPLIGKNDPYWGPRFPDMSEPYSQHLISIAEEIGTQEGLNLKKGVYVAVAGPNLETRAEYRFLRTIGADVVGMSTVPEVIVANHMGIKAFGASVITDECYPEALKPAVFEEIIAAANAAEPALTKLFFGIVERL
jgi:purine-nucleoside phosphorylase